jgi:adenylate cyclase class 2
MQEVEAKFYVMDLAKIESHLRELDAQVTQPRVLETNIRFDLPDASFRSQRRVLRLRHDTEARLTYKDPSRNEQGVLSRREIEFMVEDFDTAKDFLEALGYRPIFFYEKYRTTYSLESDSLLSVIHEQARGLQNCHIMLDELPYGNFVEIEGDTLDSIQAISDKLELKWNTAIGKSYNALFEHLCTMHTSLDHTQLTFAALNGLSIKAEELSVQAADT